MWDSISQNQFKLSKPSTVTAAILGTHRVFCLLLKTSQCTNPGEKTMNSSNNLNIILPSSIYKVPQVAIIGPKIQHSIPVIILNQIMLRKLILFYQSAEFEFAVTKHPESVFERTNLRSSVYLKLKWWNVLLWVLYPPFPTVCPYLATGVWWVPVMVRPSELASW